MLTVVNGRTNFQPIQGVNNMTILVEFRYTQLLTINTDSCWVLRTGRGKETTNIGYFRCRQYQMMIDGNGFSQIISTHIEITLSSEPRVLNEHNRNTDNINVNH